MQGDWSEKDSDGTSSTDGEAETKRKQIRLEQSARGRSTAIWNAGEDPTLANLSFLERVSVSHGTETKYKQEGVEQFLSFCGQGKTGARRGRRGRRGNVQYLNMTKSQGRPVSDGEVLLAGLLFFQPQYGKLGGQKLARSWESSGGLEKEGSDKIKTTITKSDLARSLLGDGEEQETFDGRPRPGDGRKVLPTWRTLAVDAKGLDQTNAWCGKRLVITPPRRSTRRTKQNTLSYDDTIDLTKSNLSLDHQSGCSLGGWPSLREDLPSTDTKNSPRNFGEQHAHWDRGTLFRTSAAILGRHWTKRDNTAPRWRSKTEKVEVRQMHCPVRKIWKSGASPERSQQQSTNQLRSHRLSSRGAYLWARTFCGPL